MLSITLSQKYILSGSSVCHEYMNGLSTMAANNVGLPAGVSKEQVGLFISAVPPLMGFLYSEVDTLLGFLLFMAYGMAETEMEYRVELFNREEGPL
ncbi:hypothetical protein DKX38_013845 [Salix brachista]|uniref:Uncharacterized protein n=1 Tax=Salix brachista TaxID=2182728 RepID=A0A5N5LFH4_9ROSI|nr:hypothetical protein DKX38_013845 [Salix brachista]